MRFGANLTVAVTILITLAACSAAPKSVKAPLYGAAGCTCDWVSNVDDRVFFGFNKSGLSGDAEATLGRQAHWLVTRPKVEILVAGNADERGTETYNLALGQRRADVARDELVADGVATSRIRTISYGKDCPVAGGHDEAAYAQNRNAITSVQGSNPQNCH